MTKPRYELVGGEIRDYHLPVWHEGVYWVIADVPVNHPGGAQTLVDLANEALEWRNAFAELVLILSESKDERIRDAILLKMKKMEKRHEQTTV